MIRRNPTGRGGVYDKGIYVSSCAKDFERAHLATDLLFIDLLTYQKNVRRFKGKTCQSDMSQKDKYG